MLAILTRELQRLCSTYNITLKQKYNHRINTPTVFLHTYYLLLKNPIKSDYSCCHGQSITTVKLNGNSRNLHIQHKINICL